MLIYLQTQQLMLLDVDISKVENILTALKQTRISLHLQKYGVCLYAYQAHF